MKIERIIFFAALVFLGSLLPEALSPDVLRFATGCIVGLVVGAVAVLFALSEGARREEKLEAAGKCARCGR